MTNDKTDFTQGNILKKLVAFMKKFEAEHANA